MMDEGNEASVRVAGGGKTATRGREDEAAVSGKGGKDAPRGKGVVKSGIWAEGEQNRHEEESAPSGVNSIKPKELIH